MYLWEVTEYIGEGLVFIGVVGEVLAEWKQPHRQRLGRASSLVLIIGLAISLAALIGTNEHFNGTIANLNNQAAASNREAGDAQRDAADAHKDTAQLQKDTEGLKTEAANAKRDMVEAQLELARLTGPIQSVPVVNGIAAPDPTKGLRFRVLMHTDVRVKLPTLTTKAKAITWTLFMTQDNKGGHQFSTLPRNVMFGNDLASVPHSFCTMEFVTDEYGTTDITFGSASCPSNQIDTRK